MKKHKNDCLVLRKGGGMVQIEYDKAGNFNIEKGVHNTSSDSDYEETIKLISKRYLECKKRKKVLVIPAGYSSHENIIIFNYQRKEVERFEPHGSGIQGGNDEKLNKNMKEFVDEVNENLPESEKLTYISPIDICPLGGKGFQDFEDKDLQKNQFKSEEFGGYKVSVGSDSGYCCAWSYFYLDLRMSNLKISGNDIYKKVINREAKDPNNLKKFIRGLTNDLLKDYVLTLKKVQKKLKYSDEKMSFFIIKSLTSSRNRVSTEQGGAIIRIRIELKDILKDELENALKT